MKPILDVKNLAVDFDTKAGIIQAVDDISLQVFPGEIVGIVGESGCGKSVTAQAVMRLVNTPPGRYRQGKILFQGVDLLAAAENDMEKIRGNDISMIFQDPMTALNPVLSVGLQIAESLRRHQHMDKSAAYGQAVELLRLVGIPAPEQRIREYPHQFSGGMRQRVVIAIALACSPQLLLADEPTTALDVTIQAQILELMRDLQQKRNMAILFISHDLGAIAALCSRVIVMYAGKIVEQGTATDIFHNHQHPYTWGLLQSVPRLDAAHKQKLAVIDGQPPDLLHRPPGCPFHPRCHKAMMICAREYPDVTELSASHYVNCWLQHRDAPRQEVTNCGR